MSETVEDYCWEPPPRTASEDMMVRARCMRCGNLYEEGITSPYLPELCFSCFQKAVAAGNRGKVGRAGLFNADAFNRFVERYRKGRTGHPLWTALEHYWAGEPANHPF